MGLQNKLRNQYDKEKGQKGKLGLLNLPEVLLMLLDFAVLPNC